MLLGCCRENFRINFIASFNSVGNRHVFALQETCLHGYFHLPRPDNAGSNDSLRTQVTHVDLFAWSAIGQGFAGHAYVDRGATSADHHLVAAPNDLGYLQMSRKKNLVTTELPCQFLADRLIQVGEKVLTQLTDIASTVSTHGYACLCAISR